MIMLIIIILIPCDFCWDTGADQWIGCWLHPWAGT